MGGAATQGLQQVAERPTTNHVSHQLKPMANTIRAGWGLKTRMHSPRKVPGQGMRTVFDVALQRNWRHWP
eukprot:4917272-Alexandrium_andersonii.AAC.1